MTKPYVSKLRPLGNEVLIEFIPRTTESLIYVKENPDEQPLQKFHVRALGTRVTTPVSRGDVVGVDWREITDPVEALNDDGDVVKIGFTKETSILVVYED